MKAKGQISWWQLFLMVFVALDGTALIVVPRVMARLSGRDAWISTLLGLGLAFLTGILNTGLGLRFPTQTIIIYLQTLLGRLLGKALGAIYIAVFAFLAFVALKASAHLYTTVLLHATPRAVLSAFTVSLVAWLLWTGLENLGRLTELLAPFVVVATLLVIALSTKFMDPGLLLPVFERGPLPALAMSRQALSFLGMSFVVLFLIPNLNARQMAMRATLLGILLGGMLITLMVIGSLATFGPRETQRIFWPGLELAKMVHVGEFIERIEALFVTIWVIGGFLKIGILLYCVAIGIADWMGLRDYRPLVPPLAGALFISDMIPISLIRMVSIIDVWVADFIFIFSSLIPALLLIIATIRGKRGEEQ